MSNEREGEKLTMTVTFVTQLKKRLFQVFIAVSVFSSAVSVFSSAGKGCTETDAFWKVL